MTVQVTSEVLLDVETCCACGTPFGIEHSLRLNFLRTGKLFTCPNGHEQHYGNSIEKQLEETKRQLENERQRADGWKEEAEIKARELKVTRSELTRTKKRVAGGVCPCCHRQFVTLARHMKTKHPDYEKEQP